MRLSNLCPVDGRVREVMFAPGEGLGVVVLLVDPSGVLGGSRAGGPCLVST